MEFLKRLSISFVLGAALGAAIPADAQSNTFVRFRFSHGSTLMGDMVVELFDHDKPATVQNFLKYVRLGGYDDLLLHRCEPGFVLQAGAVRNPMPKSSYVFNTYVDVPDFEPITNEFAVGPQYSNVFGTIAMARLSNPTNSGEYVTNSATSDWFFNLGNNSTNLDSAGGGFTVFGRVVSGTNLLDYFNSLSLSNRLLDLRLLYGGGAQLFQRTPVSFSGFRYPRFRELITVKVSLLNSSDTIRPKVTIATPRPNERFTNETGEFTFTGAASDDTSVGWVWYSLNYATETNAAGTTTWSATIPLPPGTNYFSVQSVDESGNRSAAVALKVYRVVPFPLDLHVVGPGTVKGATNDQMLEVNQNYLLTAVPFRGNRFAGWEASLLDDTNSSPAFVPYPQVIITMQSNLSLTASFVTNPFPPLKATYSGLFLNTNNALFIHPNFGVITLSVSDQGRVTGKVRIQGKSYPFSGNLPVNGFANFQVPRAGQSTLLVEMTLDVTNRSEIIKGFVYDSRLPPVGWSSPFEASRVRPGTKANPSPYAGSYTVLIPGKTNAPTSMPVGDGFGRVTVSAAGNLSFAGTLADGSRVTQGVPVTTNGLWPFYSSLYSGQGSVVASVKFDSNQPGDDLSGATLGWFRPPRTKTLLFPAGFSYHGDIIGSSYRAPSNNTVRMLDFTNGIAAFVNGNLADPLTNDIALGPNNVVTNLGTNKLTFSLTKSSGLFSGKVTPTNSTKAISFKGAVLQKQNFGAGFFLGTNQSGRVYFGP